MSIEHARKHGPFDLRYPPIRHKAAPVTHRRPGEARTGWDGFLGRFYPGCRRHDFDALAAYGSYCTDEESPAAAETERWEGEGGAGGGRRERMEATAKREPAR